MEVKLNLSTNKIDKAYQTEIPKIIIPYSEFYKLKQIDNIYSGKEQILFEDRHPIFKCLLRIEFEDAMREYIISLKSKI